MNPLHTNNFKREAGCPFDEPLTTPLQEGKSATPVSAEEIRATHISKILNQANGSYKDLAEDGYDAGYDEAKKEFTATPASTQWRVYVEVEGTTPPERNAEYYVNVDGYKSVCIYADEAFWSNDNKMNVTSWLKPLPSTPAPEVTDEEIENAAKEFAADYGYYPNQIITAFKEGVKFIAGYKAHQRKQ